MCPLDSFEKSLDGVPSKTHDGGGTIIVLITTSAGQLGFAINYASLGYGEWEEADIVILQQGFRIT